MAYLVHSKSKHQRFEDQDENLEYLVDTGAAHLVLHRLKHRRILRGHRDSPRLLIRAPQNQQHYIDSYQGGYLACHMRVTYSLHFFQPLAVEELVNAMQLHNQWCKHQ